MTPYDTGQRLEPQPWVARRGRGYVTGMEEARPSVPDDFGRVDFDDEGGMSVLGVFVEQAPTGQYRVHVWPMGVGPEDVEVVVEE